jgi:SAM-dependent methyltransferase
VGEELPFPEDTFDLVLSHEVLEHVDDDVACLREIVRCLKPGGRLILFCPNRWYPFETHGIYWKGKYHLEISFGVNYLPRKLRDKLAPHVNVYTTKDLLRKLNGLPVEVISRTVIFGAYDNIIARSKGLGLMLRKILLFLEKTPLKVLGLSHFWVIEKKG